MPRVLVSIAKAGGLSAVTFAGLCVTQDVETALHVAMFMFLPYLWVARLHTSLREGKITWRLRTFGGNGYEGERFENPAGVAAGEYPVLRSGCRRSGYCVVLWCCQCRRCYYYYTRQPA